VSLPTRPVKPSSPSLEASRPLLLAILLTLLLPASALAEQARDFYAGKRIELLVGYGAGGGYDTYARLIAPHLAKRTGAEVIVINRPGGGGLVALNQLSAARPDGLKLMLANGSAALLGQLLDVEGVSYDLSKVTLLARVTGDEYLLLAGPESSLKGIRDLQTSPRAVRFAAGGKTDGLSDAAAMTCRALALNCRITIGYKGSSESVAAVLRGEADALTVSVGSGAKYVAKHGLTAVVSLDRQRSAIFPDLPTVFEEIDLDTEQAWWFDFHASIRAVARIVVTTPGIPEARRAFLEQALTEILTDPTFVAEAASRRRPINYLPADAARNVIDQLLNGLPASRATEVRQVLLERYY